MPYCRDCDTEFAELLPWCPNCGALYEEDADEWEVDDMADDELVPVYNAKEEIDALLYRSMLEEAGIPVVELPFEESWLEGVKQLGLHSQLLVRQEDAERATQLVDAFRREADEGVLDAEKNTEVTEAQDEVNQ